MAKYLITDTLLNNLADSISLKTGEPTPMTLTEMKTAIDEYSPSGGNVQSSKTYSVLSSGAQTIEPDTGYDSMAEVALDVPSGVEGTPVAIRGTVSDHSVTVTPSVTNGAGYIAGGTQTGGAIIVSASSLVSGTLNVTSSGTKDVTNYANISVSAGTATSASSITGTGATASSSGTTITLTKSVSNTPRITTAGYISSGTAGNSSVSLSATDANFTTDNIKKDVVLFGKTGTYEGSGGGGGDAVTFYSGETPPSAGTGSDGDLYLQTDDTKTTYWQLIPDNLPNDGATRLGYYMSADTANTDNARTAYIRCTPTVAAGVTIDWGDGTTTTTDSTSAKNYSHKYTTLPASGYYIQTIKCTSGTVSFVGSSSYSIWGANSATAITAINNTRIRWAVIGSSCTSVGTYAFCRGYGLEEVKIIPQNCTLGTYAFYYCYGLKRINIPTGTSVTSIPSNCFNYCYALGELEIPSNITTIATYAFNYCHNLKPIIKGTLTSIGTYAFQYCYSMPSITLSTNATLNSYTVAYCRGFTNLTIPATTTTINSYALAYLYSLQELHFKGATPPTMSATTVWQSLPTSCKIYVPTGKLTDYTGASNYPSSSTYTYVEE